MPTSPAAQARALLWRWSHLSESGRRDWLTSEAAKAARLAADRYCCDWHGLAAEEGEDLEQEALYTALRAVARFDPARGVQPLTFFYRQALGGIQHYHEHLAPGGRARFRAVRTAEAREARFERELAEARSAGRASALSWLERLLRRARADLATEADLRPLPLSLTRTNGEEEVGTIEDRLVDCAPWPGSEPPLPPEWERLEPALAALDPRTRRLLWERFWQERSQSETGEVLGISQMQVSRLERRALRLLREAWSDEPPAD